MRRSILKFAPNAREKSPPTTAINKTDSDFSKNARNLTTFTSGEQLLKIDRVD